MSPVSRKRTFSRILRCTPMDIEDECFQDVFVPRERVREEVPVEGGNTKAPEDGSMLPTKGSEPVAVENGLAVGLIHGANVTPAIE